MSFNYRKRTKDIYGLTGGAGRGKINVNLTQKGASPVIRKKNLKLIRLEEMN